MLPVVLFMEMLHLDGQLLSSALPTLLGRDGRNQEGGWPYSQGLYLNCLFQSIVFQLGCLVFALTVGCSVSQLQGSDFYLRGLKNHPFLFINQGPNQITEI